MLYLYVHVHVWDCGGSSAEIVAFDNESFSGVREIWCHVGNVPLEDVMF